VNPPKRNILQRARIGRVRRGGRVSVCLSLCLYVCVRRSVSLAVGLSKDRGDRSPGAGELPRIMTDDSETRNNRRV